MTTFTGKQAGKFIEVFEETSSEQAQRVLGSGLLADVRDAYVERVNRDKVRKVLGLPVLETAILEYQGTILVRPSAERFDPLKHFLDKSSGGIFKFIGSDFISCFCDSLGGGLTRGSVSLDYSLLRRAVSNREVLKDLGSERAEISPWVIFRLAEAQSDGGEGPLLVDKDSVNLLHAKHWTAHFHSIILHWDDGWCLNSYDTNSDRRWGLAAWRVFSLDFSRGSAR